MLRTARLVSRASVGMTKRAASTAASASASSTPKRARATPKSDADGDAPRSPAAPTGVDHVAPDWVPRNKELPKGALSFERPQEGDVRMVIWNITSLKSSDAKGLMRYIKAEDPDVLILSETKVRGRADAGERAAGARRSRRNIRAPVLGHRREEGLRRRGGPVENQTERGALWPARLP